MRTGTIQWTQPVEQQQRWLFMKHYQKTTLTATTSIAALISWTWCQRKQKKDLVKWQRHNAHITTHPQHQKWSLTCKPTRNWNIQCTMQNMYHNATQQRIPTIARKHVLIKKTKKLVWMHDAQIVPKWSRKTITCAQATPICKMHTLYQTNIKNNGAQPRAIHLETHKKKSTHALTQMTLSHKRCMMQTLYHKTTQHLQIKKH